MSPIRLTSTTRENSISWTTSPRSDNRISSVSQSHVRSYKRRLEIHGRVQRVASNIFISYLNVAVVVSSQQTQGDFERAVLLRLPEHGSETVKRFHPGIHVDMHELQIECHSATANS